jgi:hypothetical protein
MLNFQADNLNQHSQGNEGNEVATKYSESVPVVSYCSKGGEGNYESLGQRRKHIDSHSISMAPTIHISRIDRIETNILKHKRLDYGMKSAQSFCMEVGSELFSSELQKMDMNLNNSISSTTEQCEAETSFNNKTKTVNHKQSKVIPSLKEDIRPKGVEQSIARKDISEEKCHTIKVCSKNYSLKKDSANSAYRLKPSSMIVKSDGAKSSENNIVVNSDSRKGAIVSKTSLQRLSKLENSVECKEVEGVMKTGVALHEKSKELFHEPEELAEVSASAGLQTSANFERDKNKKITVRSVPESSSVLREMKNMGITKIILLHRAKELSDSSPEQNKLLDLQKNVQNSSKIVEMKQLNSAPKRLSNKQRVEVPVSENCVENNSTTKCRNITKVGLRWHEKQQEKLGNCSVNNCDPLVKSIAVRSRKVTKKSQEQSFLPKSNVHNDSDFVDGMKGSKSRNKAEEKLQLSDWKQEELGDHAGNSDSVPQPTVDKLGLYNEPKEQSEALKNNVQNESNIVGQEKPVNSRKGMEKSTGLHKKQPQVLGNCAMIGSDSLTEATADNSKRQFQNDKKERIKSLKNNARKKSDFAEDKKKTNSKAGIRRSERLLLRQKMEATNFSVNIADSLAKPKADRSIKLHQKPLEEVEVANSANNLHGQSISSITLSQSPKKLVCEGEKKIESFNSEILYPLQNKQIFINIAPADRLENTCHMTGGSTADLMLKNNQSNEQVACTNKALTDRFKETENMTVDDGNSSELHQDQQMTVNGNVATDKPKQVLQEPCRMVGNQDSTEFSTVINGGKSHEVEKSLRRVLSKSRTSSDNCTEEQRDDSINSKDSNISSILRNDVSSHSTQKHGGSKDRKLGSLSDTSCGSNKQKYVTSSSKDNCFVNSDFICSKTCAKISTSVSKMKSEKNTKKGIQEYSVIRKQNHSRLDPAKLQQLINEWNSDTETVRSDEFLQDDQPSHKHMMPQDMDIITHPSVITLQQHLEEKDINEADDEHKNLLLGEASSTNGKNTDCVMNDKLNKYSKSSSLSHTISVKLQNLVESTPTSRNEELTVSENLKAKCALNSSSTQKLNAQKNVKSPFQLKHTCSSPNEDNLKKMQGVSITKIVPSPEALAEVSKTQETSNDSVKTPSRKRKLHSLAESPELIELEDGNDRSWISNPVFPYPSSGEIRSILANRKSNVNETMIKELQGENRERRKETPVSACSERDQSRGVSKSTQFLMKNFSGRWRNKYLEEVTKRKGEKKSKQVAERPLYSSVYSDLESDSDSDISWLEPKKQKVSKIVPKPKITYEKKGRRMFPYKKKSKQLMMSNVEAGSDGIFNRLEHRKHNVCEIVQEPKLINEKENKINCTNRQRPVFCPKNHKNQSSLPATEKSIDKPKTGRIKNHKPTAEKHVSLGRKSCMDHSVETYVTRAVENRNSYFDVLRGEENETEEAVPIEINILPCLKATATFDDRHLPSYSYSKRVSKAVSPCARDIVPLSPVHIASPPTDTEAINNSKSVLSKSKTMVQHIRADVTPRKLSQQDTIHSSQKSMPFILDTAAEHSDDKCVQSSRGVLKSDKKSRYSNKENTGYTTVAKEQKKWKKNSNKDVTSDGRTVTMRKVPVAGGK